MPNQSNNSRDALINIAEKVSYAMTSIRTYVPGVDNVIKEAGSILGNRTFKEDAQEIGSKLRKMTGIQSKETKARFDEWYADKLSDSEKRILKIPKIIPVIGTIPTIVEAFSKKNILMEMARDNIHMENVEKFSKQQLTELYKLKKKNIDTTAFENPEIKAVDMKIIGEHYKQSKQINLDAHDIKRKNIMSTFGIKDIAKEENSFPTNSSISNKSTYNITYKDNGPILEASKFLDDPDFFNDAIKKEQQTHAIEKTAPFLSVER